MLGVLKQCKLPWVSCPTMQCIIDAYSVHWTSHNAILVIYYSSQSHKSWQVIGIIDACSLNFPQCNIKYCPIWSWDSFVKISLMHAYRTSHNAKLFITYCAVCTGVTVPIMQCKVLRRFTELPHNAMLVINSLQQFVKLYWCYSSHNALFYA